MNFSAWSIHKPIPAILLFTVLTLAGFVSFHNMEIQDMPDLDVPAIGIVIALPGATPTQVETEITRKVEAALSSLSLVKHISSSVTEGVSESYVSFRLEKDMRLAMEEVRNAVESVRGSLPSAALDPFITQIRVTGSPILTYAVKSDVMDEVDLSWFVDDAVGKALLNIAGVGSIIRHGGVSREILVELDSTRLQALNVTVADVSQQISLVQQDSAGGYGSVGGGEQVLRSIGTADSVDELKELRIPLGEGLHSMRLGDIAGVSDTISERRSMALHEGESVVSFQVNRAQGVSEVTLASDIREAIKSLEEKYPHIQISEVSDSVTFTQQQYETSMRVLWEGALLTILVVWFFLRDKRATFISAIALPLSIVPTFLVMELSGYTLNVVTLLAITLIIGVLVDDAIVEVENIVRHLNLGKTPFQAALDAADEIGLAVIATSATLIAVFLPTAFIGGVSGRIFQQFGWTTSIAVIGSLLVARLLTPMMAAYMLKRSNAEFMVKHQTSESGRTMGMYIKVAKTCLNNPIKTCLAAGAFFIFSLVLASALPEDFIPPDNSHEITVTIQTPPGGTIDYTASVVEAVQEAARNEEEVISIFASIGLGAQLGNDTSTRFGDVDNARVILTLNEDRARSRLEIESSLRERLNLIPGARFSVGSDDSGEKFSIVFSGDDPVLLQQTALNLAADMRTLDGFGNVSTTASMLKQEIQIRLDPIRASDLGVSTLSIAQVLRIATGGEDDINLPKLNLPTRQVPIRIKLDEESRENMAALSELRVPAKVGTVPLSSVAELSIQSGPTRIDRLDRSRNVTVEIELNGRSLSEASALVDQLPTMKSLPAGVERAAIGDLEAQQELIINFLMAIITGIVCVYVVLVLLLDDFFQPLTILSVLPLTTGGAFAALWLCDFGFSMPSLIGIIMLIGVVTKNSILLVDYIVIARNEYGMERMEAILDACRKRARPIIMTTIAMVAGMLPMALGFHGDASFSAPMAVVVIGGLLSSTVLSLLVVPVVYELIDNMSLGGKKITRRMFGPAATSAEAS